jgi:hypothetical protein
LRVTEDDDPLDVALPELIQTVADQRSADALPLAGRRKPPDQRQQIFIRKRRSVQ